RGDELADAGGDPLLDRRARRRGAAERDHSVPLHRADAQRREPRLRRALARGRDRGSGVRVLRHGGGGGRGGRGTRDRDLDLPPLRDGGSEELQPVAVVTCTTSNLFCSARSSCSRWWVSPSTV